jgi:hypothetical protein
MKTMLRAVLAVMVAGAGIGMAQVALAAPAPNGDSEGSRTSARAEFVEARQFRVAEGRIASGAGQPSARQTITAWQVARGWWNGQSLDGLSLVMVQTVADDGSSRPLMNCYVSHLATPAQRRALVSAYAASLPGARSSAAGTGGESQRVQPEDTSTWRIEPAVIRIDSEGGRVTLHLGTIA